MTTSARQFATLRIGFGTYLVVHFAMLIPYAPELWSQRGMLPDPHLVPTHLFPNVLAVWSSPNATMMFLAGLSLLAALYLLGVWRRPVALLLWYGWACLFARNPLISNPGIPYVGWLLLATTLIPEGEGWALKPLRPTIAWRMPPVLYWGGWALLAAGYTASGLHKLTSPSWQNGTAFLHVLTIPLARDTALREALTHLPHFAVAALTFSALALEILVAPLALVARLRPYVWLSISLMQVGILSVVAFADLTLGMLMMHAFVFDQRWLPARAVVGKPVLFFDGVCGLCNKAVDVILSADHQHMFQFAPLQGAHAREMLPAALTATAPSTLVLVENGQVFVRSRAALRVATALGGFWWLCGIFYVVPTPIRDAVYDFVATHRYRWFGKRDACRLPTAEERTRFLA